MTRSDDDGVDKPDTEPTETRTDTHENPGNARKNATAARENPGDTRETTGDEHDNSDSAADHEFRTCPRCGEPITRTTMIGPTDAVAGPCGCRVAPPVPDRSDET
ncbi:hypothetical protein [Natrialba asiatica]|uniref:Small CPxCG-related zinc finger protein n=1 Tax=Natrialba asiatica (strain ATCC 700177 / DSM 12278 / JCM 9576 / FERM P-10747 / NBRC 102637 / 172P1) TaxID=29540 RepID=M0AYU6_NATA1|nr:hypothetical protein [Natrialba asiatica]ELZ03482.1 hypothetical protein C481_05795 [Natrialba asiatica DSM 12278]